MEFILLIAGVLVVIYAINHSRNDDNERGDTELKPAVNFHYRRKDFVMTKAENDFFNTLLEILGTEYYVFPQVHLSTIFDHKIKGQNWNAAFRYINQKSVDYVVCNRQYRRPLLGIELDDWSHDVATRKQRDVDVDYIFKQSGIPLLRIRNVRAMSARDIKAKIDEYLPPFIERRAVHSDNALPPAGAS